jgi:hypothetical protein
MIPKVRRRGGLFKCHDDLYRWVDRLQKCINTKRNSKFKNRRIRDNVGFYFLHCSSHMLASNASILNLSSLSPSSGGKDEASVHRFSSPASRGQV